MRMLVIRVRLHRIIDDEDDAGTHDDADDHAGDDNDAVSKGEFDHGNDDDDGERATSE